MSAAHFKRDCLAIAQDQLRQGRVNRRQFLQIAAALGFAPLAGSAPSTAKGQATELVIANFGGDAVDFMGEAWGEPYTRDTGIEVIFDGATPLPGKIIAQVDANNVVWDCCDGDGFAIIDLGRKGYLEACDYSIVDAAMIREGYAYQHGFPNYFYSFVLAYDASKFGADPPTSWTDFLNFDKYPGKRTLWKYMIGMPEAVLLGAGTPKDALYPMDMAKAIEVLRPVKDNFIFWGSGAESQQMFLNEEVTMGCIWHTRASVLERDTGGKITWTWNDGIYCPAGWMVPKGNPAGPAIQPFMASTLIPERQVKLLELLGNGPSNPAASAMLPDELKRIDPGHPDNLVKQIFRSEEWYADHYDAATNAWLDGIAG
ncbi:MAG: extracellular solute-binding protein [Candidatus Competibacterales bacterium]